MKNTIKLFSMAVLVGGLFFTSCKDDDDTMTTETPKLILSISGLEDLGADFTYEGWLIVSGVPVTAGTFNVDGSGVLSQTSFELSESDINNATAYVLTIEPKPDGDPTPSSVHILAGDFSGTSATLTTSHSSALGTDFTSATGSYILATPTDGNMDTNETSGVWWLDPAAGPGAGLSLPVLPNGWKYEGWAVIDGTPVTTGTFTTASGADEAAPFSGGTMGPPFPGEDFLMNAPTGLTFPTNLSGKTAVISVEPDPDNSSSPFLLKPLLGNIPDPATEFTVYNMMNNAAASNPTGSASR